MGVSNQQDGAPARKRLTRAQVQVLLIGLVALALPLCFFIIILAINLGSPR